MTHMIVKTVYTFVLLSPLPLGQEISSESDVDNYVIKNMKDIKISQDKITN